MESKGSAGAVASGAVLVEPSLGNALPYFAPLLVFPLIFLAVLHGGWWLAGPFVFLALADKFDQTLGMEERNMDPDRTPESRLFVYKLSAWLWACLWPLTFAFALWQMLVVGHLAAWEIGVMAVLLFLVGQTVFVVGHELVHRRVTWERRLGEFVLASASYPHYATEHVYIHHPMVCTPADPGSAPKGMSFWQYLPREIANNLIGAWRFEKKRLARSRLPVWHYSNPFWLYVLETAAWYALIFALGGVLAVLVYVVLCFGAVFSMKISNYVQHYGLRRVRMPSGRYERVLPRHAWSADYKFTNWLYYNMQRHADHHAASNRRYPLLQHYGKDESPQLPGRYVEMNNLALFPKRWFKTMDPLLDQAREYFYPEIDDWRAYDSPAFAARPAAFDHIAEILAAAPPLAAWMNRAPELLDTLRSREFTDLDLPGGFGPDPEFEKIARRGLVRLYWTRELGVDEMKEQIAETPAQNAGEAVGLAREWSNGKGFQIGVHTMRGNLAPTEAGTAVSRVVEASVSAVLSAVCEDFAERGAPESGSGICAIAFGDLAAGDGLLGSELDLLFLHEGGPPEDHDLLCRQFRKTLRSLSRDNVLMAPIPRGAPARADRSFEDFLEHHRNVGPERELLELTRARCVFASGDLDLAARFEAARREILAQSPRAQHADGQVGGDPVRHSRARALVHRGHAGRARGRGTRRPLPATATRRRSAGNRRARSERRVRSRRRPRADSRSGRRAAGGGRQALAESEGSARFARGRRLRPRLGAAGGQGDGRGGRRGGRLRDAGRRDPRHRRADRQRHRRHSGNDAAGSARYHANGRRGRFPRSRLAACRRVRRPVPKNAGQLLCNAAPVRRRGRLGAPARSAGLHEGPHREKRPCARPPVHPVGHENARWRQTPRDLMVRGLGAPASSPGGGL